MQIDHGAGPIHDTSKEYLPKSQQRIKKLMEQNRT
jgi:hypothetical protein